MQRISALAREPRAIRGEESPNQLQGWIQGRQNARRNDLSGSLARMRCASRDFRERSQVWPTGFSVANEIAMTMLSARRLRLHEGADVLADARRFSAKQLRIFGTLLRQLLGVCAYGKRE